MKWRSFGIFATGNLRSEISNPLHRRNLPGHVAVPSRLFREIPTQNFTRMEHCADNRRLDDKADEGKRISEWPGIANISP